jgi:toxin YhaV
VLDEIPRDSAAAGFRLGKTLGAEHRHWRRARFLGRFRLFFRYSSAHKTIIYAWLNDERSLRQAGGQSDPYATIKRRLARGAPPDDWDDLMRTAGAKAKGTRGSGQ